MLAQNPTNFPYGIKNTVAPTDSTPAYFTTAQVDGVHKKTPAALVAFKSDLPLSYAVIVYVNDISPLTATIFDDENPPTTNDNAFKADVDNLYIGTDASTWVWNGSTYVTKTVSALSNFKIIPNIDAGNNKSAYIYREGSVGSDGYFSSKLGYYINKNGSNIAKSGGFLTFNSYDTPNAMMFQLNASNGLDLWSFTSSIWTKRFTFSSAGYLTANSFIKSGGTGSQFLMADGTTTTSAGAGTVTSVSVVTANGISGSVATSTTTPAITLSIQDATTSQSGRLTSTDWNTFNNKANAVLTVQKISTNTTLSDSDNGKVILLTASCTVTLPNGLMNGFNCSFSTLAGATLTYSLGGSVVLFNNLGTTMAEKLSHTIVNTGVSNEYLTAGSL